MLFLKKYFFPLAILLLLILSTGTAYLRFVIRQDYTVAYEIACDPTKNSCFAGCEDDECASTYTYARMEKYAPLLYRQCGDDITDCQAADACLTEDQGRCSVTYCDASSGENACSSLTTESIH